MQTTNVILTGTGTTQAQLWSCERKKTLVNLIENQIRQLNPGSIIAGGAEGFDAALAHAAHNLGIPYKLAIPNEGYLNYYWSRKSVTGQNRWHRAQEMVERAAEVIFVCDGIYGTNGQHANLIRNEWMLNRATHALVLDPQSPGTRHAYRLILKHKIPHVILEH